MGVARLDPERPTHPQSQQCSPEHSWIPMCVRNSPERFYLRTCICSRARSIVIVNSCLMYCQHVADGQGLSARLGVSNTPELAYSVPRKVLGDSRREPGSKRNGLWFCYWTSENKLTLYKCRWRKKLSRSGSLPPVLPLTTIHPCKTSLLSTADNQITLPGPPVLNPSLDTMNCAGGRGL